MPNLPGFMGSGTIDIPGVTELAASLLVGALLAFLLAWHFVRFGKTFSNRRELAQVFPLVILAIIFIVSVVRSSLALSLGLIGALSIVRFRTAIKEPEELGYLFIAIALGIGLGAGAMAATLVATAVIMIILTGRAVMGRSRGGSRGLYVSLELAQSDSSDAVIHSINGYLMKQTANTSLRRLDVRDRLIQATYYVDCEGADAAIGLMGDINAIAPGAAISFVEQGGIPGR